jgi:hypothetical protein
MNIKQLLPARPGFSRKKHLKFMVLLVVVCTQFVSSSFAQETASTANSTPAIAGTPVTGVVTPDAPGDFSYASYPGGNKAFTNYLIRNLRLPQYINEKIDVKIIVTFIIDQSGKITELTASDGPKALQKEAIRVVKQSGRWIPASENGMPVMSTRQQTIAFMLQ